MIYQKNQTILDSILSYAQRQPQKIAVKFLEEDYVGSQAITYRELSERVLSLSNFIASLQQKNLAESKIQRPIMLIFDSGIEYIISFLAILHTANIAITAFPPRQTRHLQRLLSIIGNSKAEIIVTTRQVRDFCNANQFLFPETTTLICIDELPEDKTTSPIILPTIDSEHIAFLQYTSGSTGMPKGVMVTHENLCTNLNAIKDLLREESLEKGVSWLPIFHDMGLIGNTLLPLYLGGTCVFMAPLTFLKNPLFWLEAMSHEKATYSMAPNFAYGLSAKAFIKSKPTLDLSSVRCLVNGAEPVKPETMREFERLLEPYGLKKGSMRAGYGMAETTLCISAGPRHSRFMNVERKALEDGVVMQNDHLQNKIELAICGSVHPSYQLKIVDPKTLASLPVNTVGEIWLQGDSVAAGYYENPEKTNETFKAFTSDTKEGPFLRTGDLGFLNQHGELVICGRVKDLIIINGRNIYPQDIELACYQSDRALMPECAAAFSLQQDNETEACVLIAEVADNLDQVAYQKILGQIKKAVFEHVEIVLHDILLIAPRKILKTTSGKIQRSACKKAYLQDEFEVIARLKQVEDVVKAAKAAQAEVKQTQSDTKMTAWLKQWISHHANISLDQVDVNKAFAEYGLSSVQLVTMIGELETFTKQTLDPWLVWEFPNIASLSKRITSDVNEQMTDDVPYYEPIAIIGIDCQIPGKNYQNINGVDEMWENLKENNDNIQPIPQDHWDNRLYYDEDREKKGHMYCSEGGFLSDIKTFDAKFFNISPREAIYLDPQQRLLLSVTWHALEDAGITIDKVKNSKTGIYVGLSTHDYDQLIQKHIPLEELNAYQATGTSFATAAGRLAYFLGTKGPCMAIDTACSSSLVSIHQASRSLQNGDCQLAIAGGVNLILSPEGNIIFCKSNMLSPRSRCSTFDIAADGYVRGEGCGVVILKKLSDALRDGNKVYAVIHGSAVNQDGASNGLTAPNLNAQVDVIKTALQRANLTPNQITHIEAHGTGTELGDPIEWEGIRRTYGSERNQPLYITSLKTRIGHLEAAAGVAGFIKTVLAIKHGQIPGHLHLQQFNPKLHQQENMLVPSELTDWEDEYRYAGVSSFGFSGTNAHIILGKAPKSDATQEKLHRPNHLWVVSAQDKDTLEVYIKNYHEYGKQSQSVPHFASLCHHMLTQRTHLPYRAFIVAQDKSEWISKIENKDWQTGRVTDSNQMAWLFTGQGSLQANVAATLHATLPEFAAIMEHCCVLSKQWLPYDLREVLLNTPVSIDINHTTYAQPALFVYEYALAKWLLNIGLKPAFLLGHSLGEYVAACLAEVMSLEDALMLVCQRAMLFSKLPNNGSMLAIAASSAVVESFINNFDDLVIALKNGPEQIVVSGTNEAIVACQLYCQEKNLRCKKIATSHAFHSPLIEPIADEFEKIANQINYKPAKIPIISNVTGKEIQEGQINAAYWRQHMLKTVEFHQGIESIIEKGIELFIEIGPKPLLTSQMQAAYDAVALPAISDTNQPWVGLLNTLGTLYLRGVDINWDAFNKHHSFVEERLLKYPFKGKEYWLPAEFLEKSASAALEHTWRSALYQQRWERLDWKPTHIDPRQETIVLITQGEDKQNHRYDSLLKKTFSSMQVISLSGKNQQDEISAALQQSDRIIYLCFDDKVQLQNEISFLRVITQELIQKMPEKPFLFLTSTDSLMGTALLSLLKSVKQEYLNWPVKYLQIAGKTDNQWFDFIFSENQEHWALRYTSAGQYEQQEMVPLVANQIQSHFDVTSQDVCLITGAYGDIGQALIESLIGLGVKNIIAVGRKEKEPVWSVTIENEKKQGLQLHYYRCDVANATDIDKLLQTLPAHLPPLTMIIHAAGTTIDQPWLDATDDEMNTILGPKALGAWYLHLATKNYPLKAFICISSLSSIFGNQGQAMYAVANSFLNELVNLRQRQHQPAQAFILGPVKNTGLFKKNESALTAYLSAKGIAPLTIEELKDVFKKQIQIPQLILSHFLKPLNKLKQPDEKIDEEIIEKNINDTEAVSAEAILKISEAILGVPSGDLSIQDNWFEAGMDSIMAAQLSHQVNQKYKKKFITAKDIFSYASAEQLATKIQHDLQEKNENVSEEHGKYKSTTTSPLSLQQQEIWNYLQKVSDDNVYHVAGAIRINGALSKDKLQDAITKVLESHDVLRCSFHEVLGQVNQHVHDDCFLDLEFSTDDNEIEINNFLQLSFDLTKAPLIRTRLIKQNEKQYIWLLSFHRLLGDAYTFKSFFHEVIRVYEGEVLDKKPKQYCDFVTWQWDNVYYAQHESLKSYWYKKLENVHVSVPVITETKLPMEAATVSVTLPFEKVKNSLNLLEKNQLTISNYLLANLFEVLLKDFKQEKLGVVVFFSGRQNNEFTSVFGDTSNDVVIVSENESNIFMHTKLLQDQILSVEDKQYFRLAMLKEIGLEKPMISFDFQRDVEMDLKTSLDLSVMKTCNVQNQLWGDDPRILSFKVMLSSGQIKLSLKYRTDKITNRVAQALLDSWLSRLASNESKYDKGKLNIQEHKSYYEASVLQQNLWQLLKKHPNQMPYYIPVFKCVSNDVDLQRLNYAFQQAIQNNPSLRISFVEQDQGIKWQLHPGAQTAIQLIKTDNLYGVLNDLLVEPIAINQPPLLKAYLLQSNQKNENSILLVRIHHLICDGISAEYFLKEIEHWYFATNQIVKPNGRDTFYLRQQEIEKSHYDYNLKHYANHVAKINSHLVKDNWLPMGCQEQNFTGGIIYQQISKKLSENIAQFCKKNQFSPYAFYLHIYCKVLSNIIKDNNVYLSIVKSNRLSLNYQDMIGYYADNIPLLVEMNSRDEDLVAEIKKIQMHVIKVIEQYQFPLLSHDMESINYKQPQFIFNQFKTDIESKLFQSADYLINNLIDGGGKQVALWNYPNPEKLNLLVRSSHQGDMIALIFNPSFYMASEANLVLEEIVKAINTVPCKIY